MMLTAEMATPFDLALERMLMPSCVRPVGIAGSVYDTSSPLWLAWSCAMAFARSVLAAVFAIAPPSTSKSTFFRPYVSITLPYAVASAEADEHVVASSEPDAPPNDTRTSPPAARSDPICAATASLPRSVTPPHFGVQLPPSTMKARLYCFTPVALELATRSKAGYRDVSTYGANPALEAEPEP